MAQEKTYIRRRRVPRRGFDHAVGLLIGGDYRIFQAIEVGEGGVAIRSEMRLPVGQLMVITFKLPEAPPIIVRGIVRYQQTIANSNDVKLGVEFLNLGFDCKRSIRSYVAAKSEAEAQLNPSPRSA